MLGIGAFQILGYDTISIFPSQCNPALKIGLPVWVWPNLGEDSSLVQKPSLRYPSTQYMKKYYFLKAFLPSGPRPPFLGYASGRTVYFISATPDLI